MPEFTCVFVDQDKEAIFEDAITLQLESDSPEGAAQEYLNLYGPTGPYVRVLDELGISEFFIVENFLETPEEREHSKKITQSSKRKQAEAKSAAKQAAQKKQVEAKEAAQSSLSSTDVLLKELIKEQKSTNGKLDRLQWFLMGLTIVAIMPIYKLLKKWDSF